MVASPASGNSVARKLVVPVGTARLVLDEAEINWIEADDYYSAVHARNRRLLLRESLDALEQRLDPRRFVRIHRSALVNLDRVREVRLGGTLRPSVVLHDGKVVPVYCLATWQWSHRSNLSSIPILGLRRPKHETNFSDTSG